MSKISSGKLELPIFLSYNLQTFELKILWWHKCDVLLSKVQLKMSTEGQFGLEVSLQHVLNEGLDLLPALCLG